MTNRPRFVVVTSPWPAVHPPDYLVYDRKDGHAVLGRWSHRIEAQEHADMCNARDREQQ